MAQGLVLITPSSVVKTGVSSSATITANGSVVLDFCESVSLNGVFTSTYENYTIVMRWLPVGSSIIFARMRSAGTDATAGFYDYQEVDYNGTGVLGTRNIGSGAILVGGINPDVSGFVFTVFGPQLSSRTTFRSLSTSGASGNTNRIYEAAGQHAQATSYDGITLYSVLTTAFTGRVAVYGWNT